MKIPFRIIVLFLILSFAKSSHSNNPVFYSINDTSKCIKTVQWADIEICLPRFDGMTECSSHPTIYAKDSRLGYKENSTFAIYLNNDTYKQIDSLEKINFDDYVKIYATESLKNLNTDQSDLDKLADAFKNRIFQEKWDEIKKRIEEKHDNLSVGKPVIIDNYSLDNNIRTFILLIKFKVPAHEEFISIMTSNIILVKKKIISVTYCVNYKGEPSVIDAKAKNNYMALRLLEMNK